MNAGHGLDEGGFAGAVIAQKAVAFAGAHIEGHAVQGDDIAEMLLDVFHVDDGIGHLNVPRHALADALLKNRQQSMPPRKTWNQS